MLALASGAWSQPAAVREAQPRHRGNLPRTLLERVRKRALNRGIRQRGRGNQIDRERRIMKERRLDLIRRRCLTLRQRTQVNGLVVVVNRDVPGVFRTPGG